MQKQIKNYCWFLIQKNKIFFRSNEFKIKMNYFKASVCAIIMGAIISFIIIGINSSNPFLFFNYVFRLAFHNLLKDQTLTYWSIYIVAGLAVIIGFKAGLFNIGVPGQMLLAGSMIIVLGIKNPTISQGVGIFAALIISILSGAILAAIAGILKAYFNIHEVVSTIMLNWIVWYVMKWMFMNPAYGMWNSNYNSTIDIVTIAPNFNLIINGKTWIISFIIAISLLIAVIFIMNNTVLGFRIKMVGKSKNAALYAGTNVRAYIIISMALSGGIAGILGMLYYLTQSTVLQFTIDVLPVVGFDAIAVALVAFTNGIAILPVALLWGIIKTATLQTTQLPDFQMSKQMGQLIFGIIIYMTAISALFIYFKPIFWIRSWLNIYYNNDWKQRYNEYKKQIKTYKKQIKIFNDTYRIKISELKQKGDKKLIKIYQNEIDNQLSLYVGKIITLKTEMYFFKNSKYKESFKIGKQGIKTKYNFAIFIALGSAIDHFVKAKNEYLLKKQESSFLKRNYIQAIKKNKGQTKQQISQIYSIHKKYLYVKLAELQTQYGFLILKQEEAIKKLRESYYPIFDEINKKYLVDYKLLRIKEKNITKQLNNKIKNLKQQHKKEIQQFKIIDIKKRKEIKHELKRINNKLKKDFVIKKEVMMLKQNLITKLSILKQQFNKNNIIIKNRRRENLAQWKNELNQKLALIAKAVREDNKLLKEEYIYQKKTYINKLLQERGKK